MNREIKFRVWNKETKRMNTYVEIYCYKDGSVDIYGGEENNRVEFNSDAFIPLQFTGLKDKNGVEIYEGDIVKCNWLHEFDIAIELLEGIGIVRWGNDNPCFYINLITPVKYGELDDEETTLGLCSQDAEYVKTIIEIIGNIHRNPELITPSQK